MKNDEKLTLKGYDKLTTNQQKSFSGILEKFLLAQGTEARKNITLKSVKMKGLFFKLDFLRGEKETYTILNPKTREWG